MKHSQDPKEPHYEKWGSGIPGSEGLSGRDVVAGQDAEIELAEDLLMEALGRPQSVPEVEAESEAESEIGAAPRSEFRQSLRERFMAATPGSFSEEHLVGEPTVAKLRAWCAEDPSIEFRERLRESFLAVGVSSEGDSTPVHQLKPLTSQTHERAAAGSAPSRLAAGERGRLRLVAFGGVLAAAAAVVLMLQRPAVGDSAVGDSAVGSTSGLAGIETNTVAAASAWELDTTLGGEEALVASVRLDGKPVASMDEFRSRIATADRVESVGADIRIRHNDDFVIELGAGASVLLNGWAEEPEDGEARVLFAESGSVRVATGPGFESIGSMILETPHVRTEVAGTVFGVDVTKGFTCVCCLEGAVHTQQLIGGRAVGDVYPGQTWIAMAGSPSPWRKPIIASHRGPLEQLAVYWA